MGHDTLPGGLRWTLIGSGVMHGLIVILVAVAASGPGHSRKPPQTVLTTKLVRLGKKREENLLPRLPQATVPPPAKVAPVAPPESDAPLPAPVKSASDRLKEMASVTDALSRLKEQKEDPGGDPEGSPHGEASSLSQALAGSRYATEIHNCVHAHYSIEGMARRKVAGKKAIVFIRVRADGRFTDIKIETSSGLLAVDRAVERAVKRCGKVSPPPKEILRQVRDDGIEFEFRVD